jgi:hypothetical protein
MRQRNDTPARVLKQDRWHLVVHTTSLQKITLWSTELPTGLPGRHSPLICRLKIPILLDDIHLAGYYWHPMASTIGLQLQLPSYM